jgi:hypothetical protein
MTTVTGSGSSTACDASEAITEAISAAKSQLGSRIPTMGLIFAGPKYDLTILLARGKEIVGIDLMACTTAGEFTEERVTHNGIAVFLVATSDCLIGAAFAGDMKSAPLEAAAQVCSDFVPLKTRAFRERKIRATTIMLMDGLCGVGELVLTKVLEKTSAFQQIVGGAAGDEGDFLKTYVGFGDRCESDALAVYHIFSKKPWGVGVGHGLHPVSGKMRVTKSVDNVVYELDGKPAFEVYRAHAKEAHGVELTTENAVPYLVENELGIYFFNKIAKARAPLAVGADGSLLCAANVPQGSSVAILDGKLENMVNAVKAAALEAKKNLVGESAAGVILFDCLCRGLILKDEFYQEVEAVREIFGNVPIAGFQTYGEIARYKGTMGGWHNAAAVVLAIPK